MRRDRVKMHLVECIIAGIPVVDGRIQRHPYQTDAQSGGGNCIFGRDDSHVIHRGLNRCPACDSAEHDGSVNPEDCPEDWTVWSKFQVRRRWQLLAELNMAV